MVRGGILLGSSLPPVLVDAVLELDNGKVTDLQRQGFVNEGSLSGH